MEMYMAAVRADTPSRLSSMLYSTKVSNNIMPVVAFEYFVDTGQFLKSAPVTSKSAYELHRR